VAPVYRIAILLILRYWFLMQTCTALVYTHFSDMRVCTNFKWFILLQNMIIN